MQAVLRKNQEEDFSLPPDFIKTPNFNKTNSILYFADFFLRASTKINERAASKRIPAIMFMVF